MQMFLCYCLFFPHSTDLGSSSRANTFEWTYQQRFLVLSQCLFGQVTLPLYLQLQGLRDIRYDPINGSQHKENHMLEEGQKANQTNEKLFIFLDFYCVYL